MNDPIDELVRLTPILARAARLYIPHGRAAIAGLDKRLTDLSDRATRVEREAAAASRLSAAARAELGSARVAVRVRCGGRLHRLDLTADGELVARGHPGADPDRLAASACRCGAVLSAWGRAVATGRAGRDLPPPLRRWAGTAGLARAGGALADRRTESRLCRVRLEQTAAEIASTSDFMDELEEAVTAYQALVGRLPGGREDDDPTGPPPDGTE